METPPRNGVQLQAWWRGRSRRFWLLVFSPFVVMAACGLFSLYSRKTAADAERQAAVFHQRMAGGEYDAIYQTTAPDFRLSLNKADSAKYFSAIHDKMGACQAPARAATYLTKTTTSGTYVQLRYRLQCANGALQETMLYVLAADGPRLAGYDATSPALILK